MNFTSLGEYASSDSSESSDERHVEPGESDLSRKDDGDGKGMNAAGSNCLNGKRQRAASSEGITEAVVKRMKLTQEKPQVPSDARPPPPSFSSNAGIAITKTDLGKDVTKISGASITTMPITTVSTQTIQFLPPQIRMKRPNISTEDMAAYGCNIRKG